MAHEYTLIRLWGKILGSSDHYVQEQQARARKTDAPEDATYEKSAPGGVRTGEWATLATCNNPSTLDQLHRMAVDGGHTELAKRIEARLQVLREGSNR